MQATRRGTAVHRGSPLPHRSTRPGDVSGCPEKDRFGRLPGKREIDSGGRAGSVFRSAQSPISPVRRRAPGRGPGSARSPLPRCHRRRRTLGHAGPAGALLDRGVRPHRRPRRVPVPPFGCEPARRLSRAPAPVVRPIPQITALHGVRARAGSRGAGRPPAADGPRASGGSPSPGNGRDGAVRCRPRRVREADRPEVDATPIGRRPCRNGIGRVQKCYGTPTGQGPVGREGLFSRSAFPARVSSTHARHAAMRHTCRGSASADDNRLLTPRPSTRRTMHAW